MREVIIVYLTTLSSQCDTIVSYNLQHFPKLQLCISDKLTWSQYHFLEIVTIVRKVIIVCLNSVFFSLLYCFRQFATFSSIATPYLTMGSKYCISEFTITRNTQLWVTRNNYKKQVRTYLQLFSTHNCSFMSQKREFKKNLYCVIQSIVSYNFKFFYNVFPITVI